MASIPSCSSFAISHCAGFRPNGLNKDPLGEVGFDLAVGAGQETMSSAWSGFAACLFRLDHRVGIK